MTKLFERAVGTVRHLRPENQDALALIVLQLARENDLSIEDEVSFGESLVEAQRSDFISDETIEALWAKHAPTSS